MKLKKVASLLLSGVMLLSQPVYAAGEVNEVEANVAGEEESIDENISTDNMDEINVSNETAKQEALDSTSSVLSWNGTFYQNQDAEIMFLMKAEMILMPLELFGLTTYQKKQKQKSVKKLNRR